MYTHLHAPKTCDHPAPHRSPRSPRQQPHHPPPADTAYTIPQRRRYSHTEPDAASADSPPAGGLDVSGAGVLRVAAARPGVRSTQHGESKEHLQLASAAHTGSRARARSSWVRTRPSASAAAAAEAHSLEAALALGLILVPRSRTAQS